MDIWLTYLPSSRTPRGTEAATTGTTGDFLEIKIAVSQVSRVYPGGEFLVGRPI